MVQKCANHVDMNLHVIIFKNVYVANEIVLAKIGFGTIDFLLFSHPPDFQTQKRTSESLLRGL